jgi:signal transduction histidine kinase
MATQVAESQAYRVGSRALAARILGAQEAERARVSRELHDETGQALTLLLVRLRVIEDIATQDEVRREIAGLRGLVVEAIDGVRRLTTQLAPGVLESLGLAASLEWLAERIHDDAGLRVDLILDRDDEPIPADIAIAVFRVAQEALTNIVRHAHVEHAMLMLEIEKDELRLLVSDKGVGFDAGAARAAPSGTIGLDGMSERVALVHGSIDVRSRVGAGTQVRVRVPLAKEGSR